MTDPTSPPPSGPDLRSGSGTAANILDSVRDAVDEITERAAPSVREFSARAAEFAASAADRAAPFVKRAGEATADASGKLATKSRSWAAELRASTPPEAETHEPGPAPDATSEGGPKP